MSARGDWIDFAELCRRAVTPARSARTIRRMIDAREISFRQRKRGAKLEFNWTTVERELRILDNPSVNAAQAEQLEPLAPFAGEQITPERFARLERMMEAIAGKMGIPAEVFAGEQRKSA